MAFLLNATQAKIAGMHEPTPAPARRARLVATTLALAAVAGCAAAQPTPPQARAPSIADTQPSHAVLDAIARQKDFADWVAAFSATARAAGIGEETLRVLRFHYQGVVR